VILDGSRGAFKMESAYDKRIIAFVDILGFANLIRDHAQKTGALKNYVYVMQMFEQFFVHHQKFTSYAFFSDCFVISVDPEQHMFSLIRETGKLCRQLLMLGMPGRGAVAFGELHHDGQIVVGPAL
jgi:hypothetical protein